MRVAWGHGRKVGLLSLGSRKGFQEEGMGGAWPQVCGGDGGSGGMGCWVFSSFWGLNNVIYCAVLLTNRTQDQFRKCEKSIAKCKEN